MAEEEVRDTEYRMALLELTVIKERALRDYEPQILPIVAQGVATAAQGGAADAARQLDALCPALEPDDEAEDYIWSIWDIILNAVKSYETTPEIQQGIICVLHELQQITRGEVGLYGSSAFPRGLWGDLPILAETFEDNFSDPFFDPEKEATPKAIREWRNINKFGALCLGAGIIGTYREATDALREALEEEQSPIPERAECRLQIACDWISCGAYPLLSWAQENMGYTDVPPDDRQAYVPAGVLYKGPETMCFRRWGFWIQRLEALGREDEGAALSEETRTNALAVAENMRTAERSLAHTL